MIKLLPASLVMLTSACLVSCGKEQPTRDSAYQIHKAEREKRLNDWAYIAKDKQVSPHENVKLLIIPGQYGDDTKCLIYTHAEYKQSTMICPDADRDAISDPNVGRRLTGIGGTTSRGND